MDEGDGIGGGWSSWVAEGKDCGFRGLQQEGAKFTTDCLFFFLESPSKEQSPLPDTGFGTAFAFLIWRTGSLKPRSAKRKAIILM
jgi:hypothetical protein